MKDGGLPTWPLRFLRWYCKREVIDEIEGDLIETYHERKRLKPSTARRKFYLEILQSINRRNFGIMENYRNSSILNTWAMIHQYGLVMFRNMRKSRIYTSISIASLALGITCAGLIYLYLYKENTYDQIYSQSEKIYRINHLSQKSGRSYAFAPTAMVPHLIENLESVEDGVRIFKYRRAIPITVEHSNMSFNEPRFGWADPSFFTIFDIPLLQGDPNTVLDKPDVVVISESIANKYFGETNPIGQTVVFNWEEETKLEVVGVYKDFPTNTSFQLDLISNLETCNRTMWGGDYIRHWRNMFVSGYLLIKPGSQELVTEATQEATSTYFTPDEPDAWEASLQPLEDIHLAEAMDIGEWASHNDTQTLVLFAIIGAIILCLGCFNFTNMVTAQAGQRTKEVGVRKVLGSGKRQIAQQTFFETLCFVALAGILSIVLIYILQPGLGELTSHRYHLSDLMGISFLLPFLGILGSVAVIAGAYPALYISGIGSLQLMRRGGLTGGGGNVRHILVTIQFVITGVLLICTLVVFQQLQFLQSKELGFDHSVIVNMPIHNDEAVIPRINAFRSEVASYPGISHVTAASHEMFSDYTYITIFEVDGIEDELKWERFTVEQEYVNTFDLKIIEGRGFDNRIASDSSAFILNESAVRAMGLTPKEAINRNITDTGLEIDGKIVGVVEDFHFRSLHHEIQPFVLYVNWDRLDYISVRLQSDNFNAHIQRLEEAWFDVFGESVPFFYNFLDQQALELYEREQKETQLFTLFSLVSLILGGMGLFGSALFTTERRFKEIGLRKVLGADIWELVLLINRNFIRMLIVAFVIAIPVAFLLMRQWLSSFAYRIDQPAWVYLMTVLLTFLLATLTVSYLSWKAASNNPIKAIKVE